MFNNIKCRHIILFICTIISVLFFYFFNLRVTHAETIILDKRGQTMICNVYGVDYHTSTSGNVTTCTNNGTYSDVATWNNTILGFNLISTRIYYNLKQGYTYKFIISQSIKYTGGRYYTQSNKPLRTRVVLANNSTNLESSVKEIANTYLPEGDNVMGAFNYEVTFTPKENSSYFDLDIYYMGTAFTGVDFTSISSNSDYTDSVPEYSTEQAVTDIINNQNNNTQDIINNQNNNTQDIINNQNNNTQDIINNQNENSDKINNSINNDEVNIDGNEFPTLDDPFENSNTPISSLVLLPVNLYERLSESVNATCEPLKLGTLYGTELELPCIEPNKYVGRKIWSFISFSSCAFMLYAMIKTFYRIYLDITHLKEAKDID